MTDAESAETDDENVSRRWLIRLLVGVGIGIPVLIEGATFLGLIRSHLLGGGDGDSGEAPSPTPADDSAVGVGEELLTATPPSETVREAFISVGESNWQFVLTVAVENTADAPYSLRFGAITTSAGNTIDGSASTGQIPAGESASVTGTWTLPANEYPETVAVTALTYSEDVQITEQDVTLEGVSVRG